MICHTAASALTWQPVPEPINGVTGTWLSCFAKRDWLRALVHLHILLLLWRHDHNVDDQNMVLPIVEGGLAMFTEENLPPKYNVNKMKSM